MNPWLQTRTYTCLRCGATYLHDRAHHHASYVCLARKAAGVHVHAIPASPAAPEQLRPTRIGIPARTINGHAKIWCPLM